MSVFTAVTTDNIGCFFTISLWSTVITKSKSLYGTILQVVQAYGIIITSGYNSNSNGHTEVPDGTESADMVANANHIT